MSTRNARRDFCNLPRISLAPCLTWVPFTFQFNGLAPEMRHILGIDLSACFIISRSLMMDCSGRSNYLCQIGTLNCNLEDNGKSRRIVDRRHPLYLLPSTRVFLPKIERSNLRLRRNTSVYSAMRGDTRSVGKARGKTLNPAGMRRGARSGLESRGANTIERIKDRVFASNQAGEKKRFRRRFGSGNRCLKEIDACRSRVLCDVSCARYTGEIIAR